MLSYSVYRALRNSVKNLSLVRQLCGEKQFSIVSPQTVSPAKPVPGYIRKPPYIATGNFDSGLKEPEIKSREQIQGLREACKVARKVLKKAGDSLKVGMTTEEIDVIVHEECIRLNAYPSPLQYKGFPKSVCTSVNNVTCHGIPDSRQLEDRDIINIDVTVYYNGYHGDTSETFLIGNVDLDGQDLVRVAREARDVGISVCKPGAQFGTIGIAIEYSCSEPYSRQNDVPRTKAEGFVLDGQRAIREYANKAGYIVMPYWTGHGIGKYFHGPPHIFHVGILDEEAKQMMKPGMSFTIEPILTEGWEDFKILEDGWTAVSVDDCRSAQFEHTVLITDTGVEILTE